MPNNPISASSETKRTSLSLNPFPTLGKVKAQCSVKVQACKSKALYCSANKASGEASVLSGTISNEVKALYRAKIAFSEANAFLQSQRSLMRS